MAYYINFRLTKFYSGRAKGGAPLSVAVRRAGKVAEEDVTLPVLSRFLGIVIAMYWDDRSPPHFHAKYADTRLGSKS